MKIPEFKRSGIGIIAEFCGIMSGFPNQAIRGGYGYIMVKLMGCGPGLRVGLLKVSWAWNMSNITSKIALILCKKIHPLFHLARLKYHYTLLKYPSKNGVREM